MSQENIERLRAMYAAFSRGEFDTAVEMAHPEVELIRPDGTVRGTDAVRAWMEPDALQGHTIEPLDLRANGNKVLVRQLHEARGAQSGIDVEAEVWVVWTFDDEGRATRMETFLDRRDLALEAAGLSE